MYASPEQRDADIAAGARRPAGELRAWLASSADALAGDLATLPEPAWDAQVITAQGITRSAAEIPWMRAREVYVHAVDLACGADFADQPAAFLGALLDDVTARRGAVGTGPALVVSATDTGARWQVAGSRLADRPPDVGVGVGGAARRARPAPLAVTRRAAAGVGVDRLGRSRD